MEKALNEIYKHNQNYLSRWHTGLANHVSMATAAMFLMRHDAKVDETKLRLDASLYTEQLSPKRVNDGGVVLNKLPWAIQRELLGQDDFMESWLSYFHQLFSANIDEVLLLWLPRLGDGLSAAAGHSIIRIHYALAVRTSLETSILNEELAISFADLASRYLSLTPTSIRPGNRSLESFLRNHSSLPASVKGNTAAGSLIEDRLFILRTLSDYQNQAQSIMLDFDLIDCLRLLSAMATESPNFTLLHAITVGQALFDILNWYPDLNDQAIRQGYRDYVVATVLGEDLPGAHEIKHIGVCLNDIFSRVPGLTNDHAQKVSYSLCRLYQEFGYEEFLIAAENYQLAYG